MLMTLIKIFMPLTSWMLMITPTLAQDDQQAGDIREKTRLCSEASGVYYGEEGCFCPSLDEFINLNQESEKQECYNHFAEEQMNTLSEINSMRDFGKNCAEVCPEN